MESKHNHKIIITIIHGHDDDNHDDYDDDHEDHNDHEDHDHDHPDDAADRQVPLVEEHRTERVSLFPGLPPYRITKSRSQVLS